MVSIDIIKEIGNRMRKADIKTISTSNLMVVLRKATGSIQTKTLKNYIKILKDEGYIRFNSDGLWEIIR